MLTEALLKWVWVQLKAICACW